MGLVWEELKVNWEHCVMNSCTHYIYWSQQIRKNEVDRVCGTNERKRNLYGNLLRKHEGKRPLGKPTCRRDENNMSKKIPSRNTIGGREMD
jgi:hypothetical protein